MTRRSSTLLPWLLYPAVMTGAFTLFALLQAQGVVTWLEFKFPHLMDWRPGSGEVKTDLEFMAVVQLAFPPLMGFLFTYALIAPARALDLPIVRLWPHGWPIWLQALLMILEVDLLRYWLHRAAHENATLWRLHAVHHSCRTRLARMR